mgnify:CR=1 FL=1
MRTVALPLPSANAALLPRPLFTIRWPARSAQTAQTRPASLNNQVTAMRGRQSSLAPRMRRQHWRPFAPPPRPAVAAPGRCCGPVRGAAWPRLITTLAAGRFLDSPGVNAQLPRLLDKVDRSLTRVSANLPLPASGNTPGNPPAGGPGNTGGSPAASAPRAALPGRRGPARRRSLAGRIAAARPAIGGAVRSARCAGRRGTALSDNACIIVSCPFPGVLLALRPLRSL